MYTGFLSSVLNFPPINVRKKINEACAVIISIPTSEQTFYKLSFSVDNLVHETI